MQLNRHTNPFGETICILIFDRISKLLKKGLNFFYVHMIWIMIFSLGSRRTSIIPKSRIHMYVFFFWFQHYRLLNGFRINSSNKHSLHICIFYSKIKFLYLRKFHICISIVIIKSLTNCQKHTYISQNIVSCYVILVWFSLIDHNYISTTFLK